MNRHLVDKQALAARVVAALPHCDGAELESISRIVRGIEQRRAVVAGLRELRAATTYTPRPLHPSGLNTDARSTLLTSRG